MKKEYDESLVIDNQKLIYHVLNKMHLNNKVDDYYDICMIALVRSAQTFDIEKGYAFSTYAVSSIKNEMLKTIKEEKRLKDKANYNTISLDEKISDDDKSTLKDVLKSNINIEEEMIQKEQIKMILECIKELKPNEIKVINHTFGLNGCDILSQRQMSKILNISQGNISKLKIKAIKKIRKKLGGKNE